MPITLAEIDYRALQYIRQHRDPNKDYPGHEESHLKRVAKLTELAGRAAGCSFPIIIKGRIAGWFHDFERSMNETNRNSDESSSAWAGTEFTNQLDQAGLYHTTSVDREDLAYAISNCSRTPSFFADRPSPRQWNKREQVQAILFVADKLEANGVMVIARRSQVVGGARLRDPKADLPMFGLDPDKDQVKAVLLESAVRITFVNPENAYPSVFRPLTSEMYNPQRDFMYGLLAATGLSLNDYASLLLNTKLVNSPYSNYLQIRKCPDLNKAELVERLRQDGGLSDTTVTKASKDLAESAIEAVIYFSNHYSQDTDDLIQAWQPRNQMARVWQRQMIEYLNGNWYKSVESKLL